LFSAYSLDLPDARFVCHIYHTCEQTSHDGATQRRRGTVLAKNRSLLGAMLSIVTKILFTTGLFIVSVYGTGLYMRAVLYTVARCVQDPEITVRPGPWTVDGSIQGCIQYIYTGIQCTSTYRSIILVKSSGIFYKVKSLFVFSNKEGFQQKV